MQLVCIMETEAQEAGETGFIFSLELEKLRRQVFKRNHLVFSFVNVCWADNMEFWTQCSNHITPRCSIAGQGKVTAPHPRNYQTIVLKC